MYPHEGEFPLLILRKRGPIGLASIIRMSPDLDTFLKLLTKHFSTRTLQRIAVRSSLQSSSPYWHLYRRCIITGTLAKRIISQNLKNENNPKLNRSITKFFPSNFSNEATQYGCDNEKRALETFLKIFKSQHNDVKVHTTGVVLYPPAPYIGGSPDAILTCQCHTESFLVELKCPFRLRLTGISNWPLLEYFDQSQNLKKNHTYTNQINLYQGILGIKTAFFVVYAKDEVIIKMINFDENFFTFQVENIQNYYTKHYLPTVIGKRI